MNNTEIERRTQRDFLGYILKVGRAHPRLLLADLVLLAVAAACYKWLFAGEWILIILIVLAANGVWQTVSLVHDLWSYGRKRAGELSNNPLQTFELEPEVWEKYKMLSYSRLSCYAIYSPALNSLLSTAGCTIETTFSHEKRVELERYIKSYADMLLPFLNLQRGALGKRGAAFFNEEKLCMASEIEQTADGRWQVQLCDGNYYNSFLTNGIYDRCIPLKNNRTLTSPLYCANYPIPLLDSSLLGNHIGVSTLAVSSNGYVLLMPQNSHSAMGSGLLAPSGSGSVDMKDYKPHLDLKSCIVKAVERELKEESGLHPRHIERTVIVGFYRDVEQGGKPEFCCLSFLDCDHNELASVVEHNSENHGDGSYLLRFFEGGKVAQKEVDHFMEEHMQELSAKLLLNLSFAGDYYKTTFSTLREIKSEQ